MRDMRDALGALGPVSGSEPELNNLTVAMTIVDVDDIVFLTSDGISDNFDPVVGKFAIPKKDLQKNCDPMTMMMMMMNDDNHMNSVNDNDQLPLPVGMLAIQNRHRKIYDPELLDSIVELMGKAALNSYQLRLLQKQYPKSRTLFQNQKQIHNNNNHNNKKKPFGYYTSSAFKSSPSSLSLISNNSSSSSSSSIVTKPTSSLPMKPFNDDKKQRENLKQKKSSTSTLLHSLSSLSSVNTGCIDSAANYTYEQIEYRIDILR